MSGWWELLEATLAQAGTVPSEGIVLSVLPQDTLMRERWLEWCMGKLRDRQAFGQLKEFCEQEPICATACMASAAAPTHVHCMDGADSPCR